MSVAPERAPVSVRRSAPRAYAAHTASHRSVVVCRLGTLRARQGSGAPFSNRVTRRRITRFVALLVGRPEEGQDLLVQRPQPQDERGCLGRAVADVQEFDALETLEDPAHGGPARRLLDRYIRQRGQSICQLTLAQPSG